MLPQIPSSIDIDKRNIIIECRMGEGSHLNAIHIAQQISKKNILLVCPTALKNNWAKEIELVLNNSNDIHIHNTAGKIDFSKQWTIISFQAAKAHNQDIQHAMVGVLILDDRGESLLKGRSTFTNHIRKIMSSSHRTIYLGDDHRSW